MNSTDLLLIHLFPGHAGRTETDDRVEQELLLALGVVVIEPRDDRQYLVDVINHLIR